MMSLEDMLSSMLFLYCKILWLPETQLSGLWGHLLLSSTAQPLPSNAHSSAYTSGFPPLPSLWELHLSWQLLWDLLFKEHKY